jgi:3-oxoacyl-[acyl-carrier protein] reductase
MELNLENESIFNPRVVIITGGTRGLGWEMVLALLKVGHFVIATGSSGGSVHEKAMDTLSQLFLNDQFAVCQANVNNSEDCQMVLDVALKKFGRIEGLVNNAGRGMLEVNSNFIDEPPKFWTASENAFRNIIETNIVGPFLMTKACIPYMLRNKFGRIVNISTSLSTMVRSGYSPYGPSKAGLEALTSIWAKDLSNSGVTANVLLPGGASSTDMLPKTLDKSKLLPPENMRGPIVWLMSNESSKYTGRRISAKEWREDLSTSESLASCMSSAVDTPSIL